MSEIDPFSHHIESMLMGGGSSVERRDNRPDPYDEIEKVVPQKQYGLETFSNTSAEFKPQWKEACETGQIDSLLANASNALEAVYPVLQNQPPENQLDILTWANHQVATLQKIFADLTELENRLQPENFPGIPPVVLATYQESVAQKKRHAQAMMHLGQPEFTKIHRSSREWGELFGGPEAPNGRLPYIQEAELMLRESAVSRETKESLGAKTIGEALQVFNLQQNELVLIPEYNPDATELTAEQGRAVFQVFINRLGFEPTADKPGWTVIPTNGVAININSGSRTVSFPVTRKLEAFEINFLIAHEFVHIIRGQNGSRQPYRVMQTGVPDVIKTEEGIAVLSELIIGEPFGNDRQRKLAARYVAVDMAVAVETSPDGSVIGPTYSPQQIYDRLTQEFQVRPKDAQDIVWRTYRGTSLHQELVTVECENAAGQRWTRTIPEVFPKDTVYFEGMQFMLKWLKAQNPQHERTKRLNEFLQKQQDFNPLALAAVGKMAETTQQAAVDRATLSHFQALQKLGFDTLISAIEPFMAGKLSFEGAENPAWQAIVIPPATPYRNLFQPTR